MIDNLRQLGDFLAHLVVQIREYLANLHASPRRRSSRHFHRRYRRRAYGYRPLVTAAAAAAAAVGTRANNGPAKVASHRRDTAIHLDSKPIRC